MKTRAGFGIKPCSDRQPPAIHLSQGGLFRFIFSFIRHFTHFSWTTGHVCPAPMCTYTHRESSTCFLATAFQLQLQHKSSCRGWVVCVTQPEQYHSVSEKVWSGVLGSICAISKVTQRTISLLPCWDLSSAHAQGITAWDSPKKPPITSLE